MRFPGRHLQYTKVATTMMMSVKNKDIPILSKGNKSPQKVFLLLSVIVAAILLLLMAKSQPAALIIHFLLGKFLYSTSNGAILFFLSLYIVVALIATLWPGQNRTTKHVHLWALPAVLLAGNLVNIWSFFVYQKQLELPLKTHFYHWLDSQNSFCYLLHNHTGKTALAFLTRFFGLQDKMTAFDTGQVFSAHVAVFIPWLLSGLLILALGLFLFSLPQILNRYQHNVPIFLLYFFSFSGCLKSMVDGGPLTYRFLPSLIVFMSLIAARNREDLLQQWKGRWGAIFLITILPLITLWQYFSPEQGTTALAPFLFLCVTFLLLLLLAKPKKKFLTSLGVALAASFLLFSIGVEYLIFDAAFFRTIDATHQITKVNFSTFTATDVSADCQEMKVYEAYLQYNNDPLKPKDLFIWDNSNPGLRSMSLIVKPLEYSGNSGSLPPQKLLTFQPVEKVNSISGALHFAVTATHTMPPIFSSSHASLFSRNNHYCYLHLLGNLFTVSGFKEFIMIPLAGNYAN